MKVTVVIQVFIVFLILCFLAKIYKISPISWGLWGNVNSKNGIAVHGYDVVFYHIERKAMEGHYWLSVELNGEKWLFYSQKNLDIFKTNPNRYLPQYGGYGAYAASIGFTVDINPEEFLIQDKKLYLFLNEDKRGLWNDQIAYGIIERANANWSKRPKIYEY